MEQNSPLYTSTLQGQNFLDAIFASQDDEAEALCQLLTEVERPLLLQLAALEDLGQIPPQFAEANRVDNPDERLADIRWWAIRGLAICGNQDSITTLARHLLDENPEIRSVAALSIGHIGQRSLSWLLEDPAETEGLPDPTSDWRSDVDDALQGIAALLNDQVGYVRQTASMHLFFSVPKRFLRSKPFWGATPNQHGCALPTLCAKLAPKVV